MSFNEQIGTLAGWIIVGFVTVIVLVAAYRALQLAMPYIVGVLIRLGVIE